MRLRRRVAGLLAAAALAAPLAWLLPGLVSFQAPSYRDQGDFFYPLKLYTADRLRAGEIPMWNPLSGAGEPWLGNGQSGVFYPPSLLFLLPWPSVAGILFLLIHFAIAVVVLIAALAVGVRRLELVALLIAISFVLIAEMLNTALEAGIDVATTSFDPLAKLAKDIAAGAVLGRPRGGAGS